MFQYKNHRFHFGGASFQIPDGYFFDSGRRDEGDILIRLHAPDQSHTVDIRIERDCDEVMVELQRMLDDFESIMIYPVAPLLMNGLNGCHVTYRGSRSQGYEAWFDLGSGNALTFVLSTPGSILDIDTATVLVEFDPRSDDNCGRQLANDAKFCSECDTSGCASSYRSEPSEESADIELGVSVLLNNNNKDEYTQNEVFLPHTRKTVSVNFPNWISAGQMIRLRGAGNVTQTGSKGDVFLRVDHIKYKESDDQHTSQKEHLPNRTKFVTPSELVDAFLAGETNMHTWTNNKPGPLRIINDKMISFETVICERYGDRYIVNPQFYSKQTEIAQNILLARIPKEKQILTTGVPFTYWGSLTEYIQLT